MLTTLMKQIIDQMAGGDIFQRIRRKATSSILQKIEHPMVQIRTTYFLYVWTTQPDFAALS